MASNKQAKKTADIGARQHAGTTFQSPRQAARARELCEMQDDRAISHLTFWPKLTIGPGRMKFSPTFGYLDNMGRLVYECFKAEKDPRMADVIKAWNIYGTSLLRVTRDSFGGTVVHREYGLGAGKAKAKKAKQQKETPVAAAAVDPERVIPRYRDVGRMA